MASSLVTLARSHCLLTNRTPVPTRPTPSLSHIASFAACPTRATHRCRSPRGKRDAATIFSCWPVSFSG